MSLSSSPIPAISVAIGLLFAAPYGVVAKETQSSVHASVVGAKRLCVLRSTVAGPVVRDDGKVYFRGQPDRRQSYIAAFKGSTCRVLNPLAILRVESDGDRICEGDRIGAVMSASQIPGPRCVIDRLVPFSGDVDDPVSAFRPR